MQLHFSDGKPPWEQTLFDYIGPKKITTEGVDPRKISSSWSDVKKKIRAFADWEWRQHPDREDLEFFIGDYEEVFLRGKKTGRPICGDAQFYPVVDPGLSGQGYGAELRYLRSLFGDDKKSTSYSLPGFRAARSAHRLLVSRALERGKPIPPEVMALYEWDGDRLVLAQPYESEDHMSQLRGKMTSLLEEATSEYERPFIGHDTVLFASKSHTLELGVGIIAALEKDFGGEVFMARRGLMVLDLYLRTEEGFFSSYGFVGPDLPQTHVSDILHPKLAHRQPDENVTVDQFVSFEDLSQAVYYFEPDLLSSIRDMLLGDGLKHCEEAARRRPAYQDLSAMLAGSYLMAKM